MHKNLVAHIKDEATYKIHLFAFKKAFLDFIIHSPYNSKLSSPVQEVEEAECSGAIKEKQLEEPYNLRGGGQDTPTMVVEEQT
jgi:hypothetical protein